MCVCFASVFVSSWRVRVMSDLRIDRNQQFPEIPLEQIQIEDRPTDGEEKIFYNARSSAKFDFENQEMVSLYNSIKEDGLQQPPVVRVITDEEDQIVEIGLIAGERRVRCIQRLFDNDEEVHDDLDNSTTSASEKYETIPCKVVYDCDDHKALRLHYRENADSLGLTIEEQIGLVERLSSTGMKNKEIAETLGEPESWVSQTLNFRKELPEVAFNLLVNGKMKRHGAVTLLGYPKDERESVISGALVHKFDETQEELDDAQDELEIALDKQDLAQHRQERAEDEEEFQEAEKSERQAQREATAASKRKERAEKKSDEVESGDIKEGAKKAGIKPKKQKKLTAVEIKRQYVDRLTPWIEDGLVDEYHGEQYPDQVLVTMQITAMAILAGDSDSLETIRHIMVTELEEWEALEVEEEEEEVTATVPVDTVDEDYEEEDDNEIYDKIDKEKEEQSIENELGTDYDTDEYEDD